MSDPSLVEGYFFMANKLATYKDPAFINAVNNWWRQSYPFNEAKTSIDDLYDSYYGFALDGRMRFWRMNFDQFVKCLMAARILDVDGVWRQANDWTPTIDQIRRATGRSDGQ